MRIVIKRVKKIVGSGARLNFYVDNEFMFTLDNGDFKDCKISAGKRAFQIKRPRVPGGGSRGGDIHPVESKTIWHDCKSNSIVKLECGYKSGLFSSHI